MYCTSIFSNSSKLVFMTKFFVISSPPSRRSIAHQFFLDRLNKSDLFINSDSSVRGIPLKNIQYILCPNA